MTTRRDRLYALAAIAALVASACGGDAETTTTTMAETTTTTTAPTTTTTEPTIEYEALPTLRLLTPDESFDPLRVGAMSLIAESLQELGFAVELVALPRFDFAEQVIQHRDYELAVLMWTAPPDTPGSLSVLVGGAPSNLGSWTNDEYDALFGDVEPFVSPDGGAGDPPIAEAHRMQEIIADEAPIYVLAIDEEGTTWLTFNVTVFPLDDVAVRRAIAHAVDQSATHALMNGTGSPTDAAVPPMGGEWHNPSVRSYDYDLAEARRLLDDAGYVWDDDGRLLAPIG